MQRKQKVKIKLQKRLTLHPKFILMVHISKTKKGQFAVTNMANNGQVLKPSETFTRKTGAWRNIKSELKCCYDGTAADIWAIVQDNTLPEPIVYYVSLKTITASGIKPHKPHVPK